MFRIWEACCLEYKVNDIFGEVNGNCSGYFDYDNNDDVVVDNDVDEMMLIMLMMGGQVIYRQWRSEALTPTPIDYDKCDYKPCRKMVTVSLVACFVLFISLIICSFDIFVYFFIYVVFFFVLLFSFFAYSFLYLLCIPCFKGPCRKFEAVWYLQGQAVLLQALPGGVDV